jgi:hypothetical protein
MTMAKTTAEINLVAEGDNITNWNRMSTKKINTADP